MHKTLLKAGLISSILTLVFVGSSAVLALPSQASAHAQAVPGGPPAGSSGNSYSGNPSGVNAGANAGGSAQASSGQSQGQTHMQAGQLKACQNRQSAITNIMNRIDTRTQNQLNLFSTIATRVENFYTSQGKTFSNYTQLVNAVNAAKAKAETDLTTLKSNTTFSCSSTNPKGMVTAFQSYLMTAISDLQNYRTAVKNLIVGVATANGVTVSTSATSTTSTGSTTGSQSGTTQSSNQTTNVNTNASTGGQ